MRPILIFFRLLFSKIHTRISGNLTDEEKIAFINGVFGAVAKLKSHHKIEVRKQYYHDDNWVEPYYIERFYEIADEYLANEVGYNLEDYINACRCFIQTQTIIKYQQWKL